MKLWFAVLVCAGSVAAADSPLVGVWEGEVNGQPAVQVTVKEVDGKLSGRIVFYFQERGEDGTWRVKDSNPGAGGMLALKAEGKTLRFEVEHHRRHGGTELGPNVPFRLEVKVDVKGQNEARLFKLDEVEAGQGLKLTRRR